MQGPSGRFHNVVVAGCQSPANQHPSHSLSYGWHYSVADPGGANPAMPPHRSWQWSLAPLGGRNSNDRIVNLCTFQNFGPPETMWATDLAPPYRKPAY